MNLPLVSVVIPTYNQPRALTQAIDSVLAQTMTDYEIVVINDGSTDDTLEHLRPYADKIRVITQPNGGIGVARNRGVAEARGKYIAPLDHDDWWMPEKLQCQVQFMNRNADCIGVSVPYATSLDPEAPIFNPSDVCGADGIVHHPLHKLSIGMRFIATSALMFNREKAAGLKYGVLRRATEDVQFHIGLFSRGQFAVTGDRILAIWRLHELNSSKDAVYGYHGMKLLRAMDSRGEFDAFTGDARQELNHYLGHLGRNAAVGSLMHGDRLRGIELYLREFPHQLRLRRFRYLMMYPALFLLPPSKVGNMTQRSKSPSVSTPP